MTQAEMIKDVLANSYAISRAELVMRSGLTRDQVKKALLPLLRKGEVERNIDSQGIEWLSAGSTAEVLEFKKKEVEPPEVEKAEDRAKDWMEGYKAGREDTWTSIGLALGNALRTFLSLEKKDD